VSQPGRYVGKDLARDEDLRFLIGKGNYVDDLWLPHMAYAAFVRSIHAHARIRRIDTSAANAMAGPDRRLRLREPGPGRLYIAGLTR
jgi:carbon-monoxide dehydrogenase large subunit